MLITRETDYAIRALRALSDGRKKTLAAICREEAIPQQFGYKILKKLAQAGFVEIRRGKEGGYLVSDRFPFITLLDLTRVMENPTDVSPCVMSGYICSVHRRQGRPCRVNVRLSQIQQMLNRELESIRLQEILTD